MPLLKAAEVGPEVQENAFHDLNTRQADRPGSRAPRELTWPTSPPSRERATKARGTDDGPPKIQTIRLSGGLEAASTKRVQQTLDAPQLAEPSMHILTEPIMTKHFLTWATSPQGTGRHRRTGPNALPSPKTVRRQLPALSTWNMAMESPLQTSRKLGKPGCGIRVRASLVTIRAMPCFNINLLPRNGARQWPYLLGGRLLTTRWK